MFHVQYEWDHGKAAENLRKHGVDFADAIAALKDGNRLEEIDTRFDYGEERIQVIGMAHSNGWSGGSACSMAESLCRRPSLLAVPVLAAASWGLMLLTDR